MGEDQLLDSGLPGHSPAISCMHVVGTRSVGGERTIQHCDVRAPAQAHQALAVLRIPGVGEDLSTVLDAVADAMEPRAVDDCARRNARISQQEAPVGDFPDVHAESRGVESRR